MKGVLHSLTMSYRDGVAGRGGLGAVMGSKHLKAVAVKGKHKTCIQEVVDQAVSHRFLICTTRKKNKIIQKILFSDRLSV